MRRPSPKISSSVWSASRHLDFIEQTYSNHAESPLGSWAERTLVPDAEIWPIPPAVDDALVVALAISEIEP